VPETADIDLSSDQAAGLRKLFGTRAPRVIAFASGRESVGRTTLVVQTAAALAEAGHSVVIVDENPGPDNAFAAFGLDAHHDLMHAVNGELSLEQVTVRAAPRVRIVPAARLVHEFDPARTGERQRLAACLAEIQRGAGFVMIDCATQRGGRLSPLALAARHLAVVVAAKSSAITHSYVLIKQAAAARGGRGSFHIVITRTPSEADARAIFGNMKRVAREHLDVRLDFLGATTSPLVDNVADALVTRLPPPAGHYADRVGQPATATRFENRAMV
jgi:flagellar biosynthesis protein FlhG